MTGGGRIPEAGLAVFGQGTFLQEDLAARVEHKNMDSAMHEAKPMHFVARLTADDLVVFVDDIKDFRHGQNLWQAIG